MKLRSLRAQRRRILQSLDDLSMESESKEKLYVPSRRRSKRKLVEFVEDNPSYPPIRRQVYSAKRRAPNKSYSIETLDL